MKTDLVVIGGGPGGVLAALRASRKGLDVILAEKDTLGGVCVNKGCIPYKTLLHVVNLAYLPSNCSKLGIYSDVEVKYPEVRKWIQSQIQQHVAGTRWRLHQADVEIKHNIASFTSSKTVKIGKETIHFDNAVIATGSKPISLPSFSINNKNVLTSDDLLDLKSLPRKLLFIGGGYIGMEVGMGCQKLGVQVEVIERSNQVLPMFDKTLVNPILKKATSLGMKVHLNETAEKILPENDRVKVKTQSGETYRTENCLVCIGRTPYTENLNLEVTNVEADTNGFIKVNKNFQTEEQHIYAVGDVTGEDLMAHNAYQEAVIAIDSLFGEKPKTTYYLPQVAFTDPQIAKVGTFKKSYHVGVVSFKKLSAAKLMNKTEGMIKIAVDDQGILRGGQIVGANAKELIHELALAIENKLTVFDVQDTLFVHPTLSEGIAMAAEKALNLAPSRL